MLHLSYLTTFKSELMVSIVYGLQELHINVSIYVNYHLNFLANIGGSLGLCMGFSLISLIEFLYFFTYRGFQKMLQKH